MFDKLLFYKSNNANGGYIETYGYPLVVTDIKSDGTLKDYRIYGNIKQENDPSPTSPVKVQSVGENIDMWNTTYHSVGYIQSDGSIVSASGYEYTDYISIKPNAYYTAYMDIAKQYTGNCIWFAYYDKDRNFLTRDGMYIPLGAYALDSLSPSDAVYMRVSMGVDSEKITKQMLVEGQYTASAFTTLSGYKIKIKATNGTSEKIAEITLDKPLYKVGNYIDYIDFGQQKVVRNINVKELSGQETDWDMDFYNDYFYANDNLFADMKNDYKNILVASTHYITRDYSYATNTTANYICFPYYNQYYPTIGFRNLSITDTDSWKTHLANQKSAGSPVTVYYPLEHTISESINLDSLPTFEGTTTYTVVSGLEPSNMYAKR